MNNNTTILNQRYEYFQNHIDDFIIDTSQWTEKSKDAIRDAYVMGLSASWAQAQLLENRPTEIYIRIIQRCRNMQLSIALEKKGNNALLAQQLEDISSYYRNELLTKLTSLIREYCL